MGGGKVKDADYYCRKPPTVSVCKATCNGADTRQSHIDMCKYGCDFWNTEGDAPAATNQWTQQKGQNRKCEVTEKGGDKRYASGVEGCQKAAIAAGVKYISYATNNKRCFYSKTCKSVTTGTVWKFVIWEYSAAKEITLFQKKRLCDGSKTDFNEGKDLPRGYGFDKKVKGYRKCARISKDDCIKQCSALAECNAISTNEHCCFLYEDASCKASTHRARMRYDSYTTEPTPVTPPTVVDQDCVTEWSAWTPTTCGSGQTQTRQVNIISQAKGNGRPCKFFTEYQGDSRLCPTKAKCDNEKLEGNGWTQCIKGEGKRLSTRWGGFDVPTAAKCIQECKAKLTASVKKGCCQYQQNQKRCMWYTDRADAEVYVLTGVMALDRYSMATMCSTNSGTTTNSQSYSLFKFVESMEFTMRALALLGVFGAIYVTHSLVKKLRIQDYDTIEEI